jgi:anti-sigma factor RsiW
MTPAAPELTCRELAALATELPEGALCADERARFEQHLASCEGCRTYLDQMHQIVESAASLPDEPLAPAARDALLRIFREWKKRSGGGT